MSKHNKNRASQKSIELVPSQTKMAANVTSIRRDSNEAAHTSTLPAPVEQIVRQRAYEFYEKRGRRGTVMRSKTGCVLRRRSLVQFRGWQESDSADAVEPACWFAERRDERRLLFELVWRGGRRAASDRCWRAPREWNAPPLASLARDGQQEIVEVVSDMWLSTSSIRHPVSSSISTIRCSLRG